MWKKHQEKVFEVIGDFKYLSAPLFRIFIAEDLEVYFSLIYKNFGFIDKLDIDLALMFHKKEFVDSIVENNNYEIEEVFTSND